IRSSSAANVPSLIRLRRVGWPTSRHANGEWESMSALVSRRIKLGTFAALDQRIALRYTLTGMSDTETKSYLSHHLKLAGRSDTLFSDDAVALIHQVSRGIPRAVN